MKLLFLLFLPFTMMAQNIDDNNFDSTQAMAFVNSLSDKQKGEAMFPFDEINRYEWHYLPASMASRNGIGVSELNDIQKKKLNDLMKVYLSEEGYTKLKNIMGFENLLKELEPDNMNRTPENYFIAIYGNPGKDSIWGWKFSGHHLALNFTIVNGKLAVAPFFFGVYPAEVKDGPQKGMRIIKDEEDFGFELENSLTQEQKQKALLQSNAYSDIVTRNDVEVDPLHPIGILAKDLTHEQKIILNKLIVAYLLSMPPIIAKTRIKTISTEEMNSISFGWAGGTEPGKPHYYRIQGKSFLVEFDNTQNNANHIHSVWRDFKGDFGHDLLKEHYQSAHHH